LFFIRLDYSLISSSSVAFWRVAELERKVNGTSITHWSRPPTPPVRKSSDCCPTPSTVCWQSTDPDPAHPVANPTTWSRSEKVSPSPNKREVSFAYKIQSSSLSSSIVTHIHCQRNYRLNVLFFLLSTLISLVRENPLILGRFCFATRRLAAVSSSRIFINGRNLPKTKSASTSPKSLWRWSIYIR
jgi:hypothetical protein